MDRNTIIGLLLMFLLVLGYNLYFAPEEVPQETSNVEQTEVASQPTQTIPTVVNEPVNQVSDSIQQLLDIRERENKVGMFASAAVPQSEKLFTLENDRVAVQISNKGGWFKTAELRDGYKTFWNAEPIQLFNPENSSIALNVDYAGKGRINLSDLYFEKVSEKKTEAGSELTMRLDGGNNRYLELAYSLADNSYEVKVEVRTVGLSDPINLETAMLDWNVAGDHNEKGIEWERQHSSVFYREKGQGRSYLGEGRDKEEETEDPIHWVAFKQNFFSAAVIKDDGFEGNAFVRSFPPKEESDTTVNMNYIARLPLKMSATGTENLRFYFGPNDLTEMRKLEVEEFTKVIDYGWWIFGWMNRWVIRPVFDWLFGFIGNMGLTIIAITILIKLILSPVTWKNFMSSAKMKVLRPEMDELNEKFKDDAMGKQQATMELYRKTGVNPFAGCLPMLLQMPILYAMFRFFPANIDLRGKSFWWADDLGAYDAILTWTQQIPVVSSIYGNHVSGFALMMGISTFFYSRMSTANMPNTQQPGMPNMKVIMNIFPIFTLIFFNRFAAGLNFYYFCANMISIAQMLLIKRYLIDENKIREQIEANKTKPKKAKGGFQQRLEEMQKLQQEKAKQQKK
ncbi:MAG: membrane protein insertase YidC [Flavobacteriales bacterium]|nr:membrane protein insertase YidC [Flavobacteriales bacterium]